jgi:hypothetical protein
MCNQWICRMGLQGATLLHRSYISQVCWQNGIFMCNKSCVSRLGARKWVASVHVPKTGVCWASRASNFDSYPVNWAVVKTNTNAIEAPFFMLNGSQAASLGLLGRLLGIGIPVANVITYSSNSSIIIFHYRVFSQFPWVGFMGHVARSQCNSGYPFNISWPRIPCHWAAPWSVEIFFKSHNLVPLVG